MTNTKKNLLTNIAVAALTATGVSTFINYEAPEPEAPAQPVTLTIPSNEFVVPEAVVNPTNQAAWDASRTNFTALVSYNNRYMIRMGQVSDALIAEGLLTNALTVASTPASIAALAAGSTNRSTIDRANSLSNCLKQVERATLHYVGAPPDESSILSNIESL